jgi:16S rRNA G966 N2-methylase RsmD
MKKATYVEQQEVLCETARHNFPLAGLQNVEVVNTSCEEYLQHVESNDGSRIIYLDPARRNIHGAKVFSISDCTPDVSRLQDTLTHNAAYVMIKLSPMLDIAQALRQLRNVIEIHVVSVRGECKELLFVMSKKEQELTYHCVNLETSDEPFSATLSQAHETPQFVSPQQVTEGSFLFEPNASIMKAGMQNAFAERYNLKKLHPMSNLFVGERHIENVPARQFVIEGTSDFQKASLKVFLSGIKQANVAIRNFPSTVDELRKRLKIKDGGTTYLFATTLADNTHCLIRCRKIHNS